jgi:hypothetical protein
MILIEETDELGENPVSVPFFPTTHITSADLGANPSHGEKRPVMKLCPIENFWHLLCEYSSSCFSEHLTVSET